MFEKLLERIIMSYFGDFLNGIDQNNLHVGIWSGNISIDNVSLNEHKINALLLASKLPFQLKYSHIGSLKVIVPWNKLSSSPVEITITDVYLFLHLKDTESQVDLKDIIANKKELIKNYCDYLSSKLLGERKDEKEQGYLNRMISKIIDNIQLSVQNIHLRVQREDEEQEVFYSLDEDEPSVLVEKQDDKSFACGFCIKAISAYTTDEKWEKKFVDRSENKEIQMRKMLFFDEISVYWEEKEVVPMSSLKPDDINHLMKEIIARSDRRLLSISGEVKFVEVKDHKRPQYDLTTKFDVLRVEMNYQQLKGIISLGDKVSEYKSFQKAATLHLLPEDEQAKLEEPFKTHVVEQFGLKFEQLPEEFQSILLRVNKKHLLEWTKQSIAVVIKKKRIQLLEKEKNQKKWWNFLSTQQHKITPQEEEQIGRLMKDIISDTQHTQRTQDSPWLHLNVKISKGVIGVLHSEIQQLLLLEYQDMSVDLHLLKNKKQFELGLVLARMHFRYIKHEEKYTNIEEITQQKIQLCEIDIVKQPTSEKSLLELSINKKHFLVDVTLRSQKLELNYESRIIILIKELLKIRNNQQLNSLAWNAMTQKLKQPQEQKQQDPKIQYKINVEIAGVDLLILVDENQHLFVSFEKVWIADIDANHKKGAIERFSAKFIHKTQEDLKERRYSETGSHEVYVIHPICPTFSMEVTELKNVIDMETGPIAISINKAQIVKLKGFIEKQLELSDQQKKQSYRQKCETNGYKSGYVKILNTFKTWKRYYCILSDSHLEFFEQDETKPIMKWYIRNCLISRMGDRRLKFQSNAVSEVMECSSETEQREWMKVIEEMIIANSTGQELYQMLDDMQFKNTPKEGLEIKETLVSLRVKEIKLLFEEERPVLELLVEGFHAELVESKYFFNRSFVIGNLAISDLRQSPDSEFYSLVKMNTLSKIREFNNTAHSELQIKVHGKKKFHPDYKGELFLKGSLGALTINFNPRLILHFVRLLQGRKGKFQFTESSQHEEAIFGYTNNFLCSNFFEEVERSIQNSRSMEDKNQYTKFTDYERKQKVLVMLDIDFRVESVRLNLIHRTTKCCNNTILGEGLHISIKNGNSFLFFELGLRDAHIYDLSNYPNTINTFEQESQIQPYAFLSPSQPGSEIKVWFSTFESYIFINQERTTSFFLLTLNNYTLKYQQQLLMRFIDYLNNQLISFILKPFSVDVYDYKYNKDFKFSEYQQFTTKEIEKMVEGLLLPFFVSLTIEATSTTIHFNSHPNLQSLPITVEQLLIQSRDIFTTNRISIDQKRLELCRLRRVFSQLEANKIFQDRILKGCWVQQMIITAKNTKIHDNVTEPFTLVIDFERLPNTERALMFPFIQQDKTLMLSGVIETLRMKLSKVTYNLLLKCMIHNLTHDDGQDNLYIHNFKHQHLMESSPMSNVIKIKDGAIDLLDADCRLHLKELQYWFTRDAQLNKKMMVNIQRLNLYSGERCIVSKNVTEFVHNRFDLMFDFVSQKNFDKKMNVVTHSLRVAATDLEVFKKVASFVLVPQECFPESGILGDLPMITCNVELKDCSILFACTELFGFVAEGEITYIWNRNRSRNYEAIREERLRGVRAAEVGTTTSHIIYLKNVELKKCDINELTGGRVLTREKIRKLSSPMNVFIRLNDILKFSSNNIIYYDKSLYYSVENASLIMSYEDISDLMLYFNPPSNNPLPINPPSEIIQSPPQFDPYLPNTITQHNLIVYSLQFQLLASSPQAPLMLVNLNDCKLKATQMRGTIPIHSLFRVGCLYYNLKAGAWQPVLEDTELSLEMKWGTQKYLRVECQNKLLIDISIEFIKIIKVLLNDIATINARQQSILTRKPTVEGMVEESEKKKSQISYISPYIIKNNLGCELMIESCLGNQHYVLQPSESVNYRTEEHDLATNQPKKVKLIINDGKSIHEIHDIDLDKIKNKLLRIEFAGRSVDIKFIAHYREILKEIIVSSCYIVVNETLFDIELQANDKVLRIERGEENALPYTLLFEECTFTLNFPHLGDVKENYAFSSECLIPHYEHYILTHEQMFNCNIEPVEDQNTGVTKIVISPIFVFKNALPCSVKIELMWMVNGEQKRLEDQLDIQEQKGYHQIGSKDKVFVKVKMPNYQFSQMEKLYSPDSSNYELTTVEFSDYRGNMGRVHIKCSKKNRVKKYTLYTQGFVVNETHFDLFYYSGGSLLPGQKVREVQGEQPNVCLIGDLKSISVSCGDENADRSECPISSPLELQELGNNTFTVFDGLRQIEFGTSNGWYCVDTKQNLYSTIVRITPKYIIVNQCSKPIVVKHHLSDKSKYVEVGLKQTLEWDSRFKTKYITMRLEDITCKWKMSEHINFHDTNGTIAFALRSELDLESKINIKLEVIKEMQYEYLVFSEIQEEKDYFITVENQLPYVRVEMYQKVIDEKRPAWMAHKSLKLKEGGHVAQYAFDYPNEDKGVSVTLMFVGPMRADFNNQTFDIDFSNQPESTELVINSHVRQKQLTILINVESIGGKKILKFTEKRENYEHQNQEIDEYVKVTFAISLKEVGISLIGETKNKRCEIIFLNLKEWELMLLQKSTVRTIQLKIKYINIDNNANHNTSNPVIFTPQKEQKALKSPRPFLLFLIEQNLKFKKTNEIKSIRISIQPTSIKLDDEFIEAIFTFVKQINNNTVEIEEVDMVSMVEAQDFDWSSRKLENLISETFVQEFEVAKINLTISFSMRPKESSSNLLIYHILSSFGVAFSKISDSPMSFSRLLLVSRNFNQIKAEVTELYTKQFMRGILRIIGSINLIGNPYSFVRYMAQGLVDVVDYPIQGFIKGPVQGAFGIVGGTVGLCKNVVAGCFNSLESMSESMSSGLSSLSMDQKYIERREKIKNTESKNVVTGLLYGTYSLFASVELAITGLYRQPVEGYRNKGFIGGCAGTLKALTGLVIKPISGICEGISKTSEGIKNTALLFEDGPKTRRERWPRVFYGEEFVYKNYNEQEAETVALLERLSTKYLNMVIIELISFNTEEHVHGNALLISTDHVILLNREQKKIHWQEQIVKIKRIRIDPSRSGISVHTLQKEELFIETQRPEDLIEKLRTAIRLHAEPVNNELV